MHDILDKYEVNPYVTGKELFSYGFYNNIYRVTIHTPDIQMVIHVDPDEHWWSYQVNNTPRNELYAPYYNREYGDNKLNKELDKKVDREIKKLLRTNILRIRKGVGNIE